MEFDVRIFNKLSFVATIPQNDARQTLQINDPPKPGSDEESQIYPALTLLGSDLMVIGKYDGKPWRIVGLYKNKPIVIAQSPAPHGGGTNQNSLSLLNATHRPTLGGRTCGCSTEKCLCLTYSL